MKPSLPFEFSLQVCDRGMKEFGALGGIRSRGSDSLVLISRVDGVTGHHPGPLNDQGVFVVSGHLNLPDAD